MGSCGVSKACVCVCVGVGWGGVGCLRDMFVAELQT